MKTKPGLNRTTLDAKKLVANRDAMMLTALYEKRKDRMMSVKEAHAELKAEYYDAYTHRCKTAKLDDEHLTKANCECIQKFMARQVLKIKERGNTLLKPGSGEPTTKLSAACKKIVEKNALVKGGSEKKVRSALAAKGY